MEALFSLLGLLVFFAIGAFSIYLLIDFIEYLKKYHSERWKQLSFERLFGISQQDFFFYQFHPLKFIPSPINKKREIRKLPISLILMELGDLFFAVALR